MKTIITLKHDNSPKSFVGNKPFFFVDEKEDKFSDHLTFNQAEIVKTQLRKLGIIVSDRTI